MDSFESISDSLPSYLEQLLKQKAYSLKDLTEGKIIDHFSTSDSVPGVYVIFDKGEPVYIGRSRTLAQRIGVDLRSIQKSQANLTHKLTTLGLENITTMKEARAYMYKNYTVKMLRLENEYARAIFLIYTSMKLETKFNSFIES